jgi:hypothetical protein
MRERGRASRLDRKGRILMNRFTRDMEQAAMIQLRNAFAQGKDAAGCIAFATASLGREHGALVRRVWAAHFEVTGGAG